MSLCKSLLVLALLYVAARIFLAATLWLAWLLCILALATFVVIGLMWWLDPSTFPL